MDLYSAFIVAPHTQGAQVWIRPTAVLPAIYTVPASTSYNRSPDGATTVVVVDVLLQLTTHLSTPKGQKAELPPEIIPYPIGKPVGRIGSEVRFCAIFQIFALKMLLHSAMGVTSRDFL